MRFWDTLFQTKPCVLNLKNDQEIDGSIAADVPHSHKVLVYQRLTIIDPIESHENPINTPIDWWFIVIFHTQTIPKSQDAPGIAKNTAPRGLVNEDIATKFLSRCRAIDETWAMGFWPRDLTTKNISTLERVRKPLFFLWNMGNILDSLDWFKGKSTGNHCFSYDIWGFPEPIQW